MMCGIKWSLLAVMLVFISLPQSAGAGEKIMTGHMTACHDKADAIALINTHFDEGKPAALTLGQKFGRTGRCKRVSYHFVGHAPFVWQRRFRGSTVAGIIQLQFGRTSIYGIMYRTYSSGGLT